MSTTAQDRGRRPGTLTGQQYVGRTEAIMAMYDKNKLFIYANLNCAVKARNEKRDKMLSLGARPRIRDDLASNP